MSLQQARAVADAVLYEGYLLYPYRADACKNQVRWQFGVLGPAGASERGVGEEPQLRAQCLLEPTGTAPSLTVRLRFLQLQAREAQRREGGRYLPTDAVTVDGTRWTSFDEAVEHELVLGPFALRPGADEQVVPVTVAGGEDVEPLLTRADGAGGSDAGAGPPARLARRRAPPRGEVRLGCDADSGVLRLRLAVRNEGQAADDPDDAVRRSFLGAHLLLAASRARFVSLLDPPAQAAAAAGRCEQHRCWPVLCGEDGEQDLLLVSPIILQDHPRVAEQSAGNLFDSTEIDEILTLRVMALTDDEKARARATDARAAQIIDRCDALSEDDLQRLHGVLHDPGAATQPPQQTRPAPPEPWTDVPWWDPAADASVRPATDTVVIDGTTVGRDSLVRLQPSRRADAQDLFYVGRTARVTAVHTDVDGATHVAVVLLDDPAADLHDWYGRYLYFAPEELRPEPGRAVHREESRP